MGERLDFLDVYSMLKRGINFIIAVTILCVGVVGILNAFIIEPVYESTTQILVNSTTNTSGEMDTNEIQTNIQLIDTYSVIIESPAILGEVVNRLGSEGITVTVEELQDAITVTSESNTQVMNINVAGGNPENTALVANTTAEVFQEEIVDIMQVENVTILSPAAIGVKIKPNAMTSTLFAAAAGLALGIVIVLVRGIMDTSIKDEGTLTGMFEIPVLGSISDFSQVDFDSRDSINASRK